jgi:hypothetical protein
MAGAAVAVAGLALSLAPHAARADAGPKSAAECRAMTDFAARGKCWDALDQETQKDATVEKKKNFGFGEGLRAPSITSLIPRKQDRVREERAKKQEVNNLSLVVASVDQTPLGRVLMTADDGAVWEQIDGDAVSHEPAPGDTVAVSKTLLGGYMCQLSRWQSVRCQRDR